MHIKSFFLASLFCIGVAGNSYANYQINNSDSLEFMHQIDSVFQLREINFNQSLEYCKVLNQKAKTTNSDYLNQVANYAMAYLLWHNGNHEQVFNKCQQSLYYSVKLKDTIGLANNFSLIGLSHLYQSDFDSALFSFNKALAYYVVLKDTTQILKMYGLKGLVYDKQGDYVKSKSNLLTTVLIKKNHNTQNWNILNLTQNSEVNKSYYQKSLINAKKYLLDLGIDPSPSKKLRLSYHNLGLAYLQLNFADSALHYFKEAGKVATELNLDILWDESARAYRKLALFDSAIYCNQKAIEVAKQHGTKITLANAYTQLGHSFLDKKNYKNANNAYLKSLKLHQKMGHKNTVMNLIRYISDVAIKTGDLQKALLLADSSFNMAERIGARQGKVRALFSKYSIFELLNNYQAAYTTKIAYDNLKDSLQNGEIQLNLAKLDLYNEVELNKLEISDLNKQQALSKANLKNRTLIIVIISIVVLFTVLLLLLNYLRTRKLRILNVELNKQQGLISSQNKELKDSNKEKELLLGEIHHRVKNNLQTIASLLSIQQRKLKDPGSIKVLEDSKNRVMAMGLIHQHLYQNASFAEIDFKNYTKELVHVLINTNATCEIAVKCNIPALKIELDNATFFGLIINELAINSIKHAYKGVAQPLLEISIYKKDNKTILLVKDNGNEKNIDFNTSNSFGWKMVNNICDKLEAQIKVDNSNGLAISVIFSTDIIDIK